MGGSQLLHDWSYSEDVHSSWRGPCAVNRRMDEWRNLDAFDLVSYEIEISGGDDSRWAAEQRRSPRCITSCSTAGSWLGTLVAECMHGSRQDPQSEAESGGWP